MFEKFHKGKGIPQGEGNHYFYKDFVTETPTDMQDSCEKYR